MGQYKRKYKEIYEKTHDQIVGSGVDWAKLEEIKNNPELKKLNNLKSVRGLSTTKLNRLSMDLRKLSKAKCARLDSDYLEDNYQCPDCHFPAHDSQILENINDILDKMWNQIIDIKEDWEEQILDEIDEFTFADDGVMDYATFSQRLNDFKERGLASGSRDNIRIKKIGGNQESGVKNQ